MDSKGIHDRLLAIGDVSWADYEVVVPFTVHALDPGGPTPASTTGTPSMSCRDAPRISALCA